MVHADDEHADSWAELRACLSAFACRAQRSAIGADGAGVTLILGGESVFAGPNGFTEALDVVEYAGREGPCMSAVATGRMVSSVSIGCGETRWPDFTSQAARLMLRSVISAPLRKPSGRREVIGSLNVYGRAARSFAQLDAASLEGTVETLISPLDSIRTIAVAALNTRPLMAAHRPRPLAH